jgi:exopolysaccharide biosynthesis polyprenyl glycosylphosphotransferase
MSTSPQPDPKDHLYAHASAARSASLRVASDAAIKQAVGAKAARAARVLNALLTMAISMLVLAVSAASESRTSSVVAGFIVGAVMVLAFQSGRRNITFARLSAFAQGVYRLRAVGVGAISVGALAWLVPWLELDHRRVTLAVAAITLTSTVWGWVTRRLLGAATMHRTLIIGDGERVGRFLAEFRDDPHPQYELAGMITETVSGVDQIFDEDATLREVVEMFDREVAATGVPMLGSLDDLETVLAAEAIDTVVVAVKRNRLDLFSRLSGWNGPPITVLELPAFSEHVFGRVPIDVINAAWFMHMVHPFFRPYSRVVKRVADIVVAATLFVFAAPLLPLVALAVKLTSRGPALYRQVRVGEHGREFHIYKFRTMRTDAEAHGAQWASKNDPRVTPIGGFLRATRIDELPQLWNILSGQMSFVGPRPERPEFVSELEHELPYYQRRHLVKPGLSGWAQVRHGYADSPEAAAHKLGYELYYLKHQSLFLDLVITIETVRVVLLRFGAR